MLKVWITTDIDDYCLSWSYLYKMKIFCRPFGNKPYTSLMNTCRLQWLYTSIWMIIFLYCQILWIINACLLTRLAIFLYDVTVMIKRKHSIHQQVSVPIQDIHYSANIPYSKFFRSHICNMVTLPMTLHYTLLCTQHAVYFTWLQSTLDPLDVCNTSTLGKKTDIFQMILYVYT